MNNVYFNTYVSLGKNVNEHITIYFKGAKLMFEAIWKHLNDVLLADQSDGDLGRRESLALQHNAYLSSHLGLYLGGDEYLRTLDTYMKSGTYPKLSIHM